MRRSRGRPPQPPRRPLGAAACFGLHVALLDRHAKHHDASALALAQVGAAAIVFLLACPLANMPVGPTRQGV